MKKGNQSIMNRIFVEAAIIGGFVASSSAQFISNGSFEAEPAGTAVAITTDTVDTSTFTSWRVFSSGWPSVAEIAATIVTNASDGNLAMQLDMANIDLGVNHALDRDSAKVPVIDTNYTISFDAAWISGSSNLDFIVSEYNASGNYLGQQTVFPCSVANPNYQTFSFEWSPLTGGAASQVNIAFKQQVAGAETSSSLLLDNIRFARNDLPASGLYTSMPSFNQTDHVVGTSVFHWYTAAAGQLSGPWLPLEGRPAWTGQPDWWMKQVKQMMMANIDMLYVHLIPSWEQQRINLFNALNQLRYEGYDVPKIAPFLDPLITWNGQPNVDVATTAGKDEFVDQYIRFFNQYYAANPDTHADDYLARFDDQVILDSWHPHLNLDNLSSLSRSDVMSRLTSEFGATSVFSNDIYMVSTAFSPQNYAFVDEKTPQFEVHEYASAPLYNGIRSAQVKGGYWDQNIRNPGYLLPRDGGTNYINAWDTLIAANVNHIYIESWNEYDEGSGIYATDPTNSPWIKPGSGNTGTDTWSGTDDPYEYIHTTATKATLFNDIPNHDATILWHNFPDSMYVGDTQLVTVVVRNTGDAPWTAAADYKFGDKADGAAQFGASRYLLDDNEDEIPVYGGIFRGRPKTFTITLIAPTTPGIYETHWGMLQEYVEWFGEDLAHTFTVELVDPASIAEWSAVSNDVMKMVVDAPGPASRYHPEASTNLVEGGWARVPHSTNGLPPFVETNLSYSTAEGTNEVIYVETDATSAEFFKIIGE